MPIKWKCMVCGKESCWSMVEQDHSPSMCMVCWHKYCKMNPQEKTEFKNWNPGLFPRKEE